MVEKAYVKQKLSCVCVDESFEVAVEEGKQKEEEEMWQGMEPAEDAGEEEDELVDGDEEFESEEEEDSFEEDASEYDEEEKPKSKKQKTK